MKKLDKGRILFLSCIFLITYIYTVHGFTDFDYWFHYACGEWIWTHKEVPKTAIYSWYGLENNLEWISHEWLFGLFIYGFSNLFGEKALVILCPILISIAVTIAFNYTYEYWKKNPILTLVISIAIGWVMAEVNVPRPQLFMYLMLVILLTILFNEYKQHSKKIWWLVPLTILWVNCHGGSYAMIFVSYFLLIICQCFNFKWGRIRTYKVDKKITINRIIVFIVALACVIFNAHGYKMFLYPITNMTDSVMIRSIQEWQSITINNLSGRDLITLLLIIYFVFLLASSKRKVDLFKLLIVGMWIFLALKSIRFEPCMCLVMIFVLPEYFDVIKTREIKDLNLTMLIVVLTLLCTGVYKTIDEYDKGMIRTGFPNDKLIEKLKELPEGTHVYTEYGIGGYLIYNHVNVFIDGRADIYSKYSLQDYVNAGNLEMKPDEFIEKYDFEYILVSNDCKLDWWLGIQNNYKTSIEYIDDNYTLYKIEKNS